MAVTVLARWPSSHRLRSCVQSAVSELLASIPTKRFPAGPNGLNFSQFSVDRLNDGPDLRPDRSTERQAAQPTCVASCRNDEEPRSKSDDRQRRGRAADREPRIIDRLHCKILRFGRSLPGSSSACASARLIATAVNKTHRN